MYISRLNDLHRRTFFKRAAALTGMGVAAPLGLNLAAVSDAAAFDATDYKALVCVFLYGGNDYADTVIPFDNVNYDLYSAIRQGGANRTQGGIARAQAALAATALSPLTPQTLTNNIQYALAPEMTGLKALWTQGKMAVQLNVGPLIVPLTLAQYNANSVLTPRPPKLFSHNDQQSTWQSDGPEGTTIGWGGRIGDLAVSANTSSTFTAINATGTAVFLSGNVAHQYNVASTGAVAIGGLTSPRFGGTAAKTALQTLLNVSSTQALESEYLKVIQRSINAQASLNTALTSVNLTTNFHPNGGSNSLADQLKIVARIIGARTALGAKRQVFMVSLGGFDLHDNLFRDHPGLLTKVDEAMSAFYAATVELGVQDKVTAFTASDFGRTMTSNGDGSDHGWGSHHFIVGGAVKGGQYYGTAPNISVTASDQVGQGRLLPTTAVDQMGATLARWFGVSASEMSTVFPNIGNFATANMGYLP